MTLKDWKKIPNEYELTGGSKRITFKNKKQYFSRVIIFYPNIKMNDKDYIVRLVDVKDDWENKYFKSKSQAFKFAKSYMRTH